MKKIIPGLQFKSQNGNIGIVVKVLTASTGYTLVSFNGVEKKVMIKSMGYTDMNGVDLFAVNTEKIAAAKQAKISEKLAITSNAPASWMNADGTKNWDKYNTFLEEREAAARNSKSM